MSVLTGAQPAPVADFRRHAFAASEDALRGPRGAEARRAPDILDAGLSLCVPTADDPNLLRATLRRSLVKYMVLGIGGIGVGGAVAFWRKHAVDAPGFDPWLGVALANSLAGFFFLFLGIRQERRFARKLVLARLGGSLPGRAVYVNVEDASTVEQMKLVSEDVALLFAHPDVGCVQIEGITARYVIYAADVRQLTKIHTANSVAVLLAYQIGTVTLQVALKDMGIWAETQGQLIKRSPLLAQLHKTFSR